MIIPPSDATRWPLYRLGCRILLKGSLSLAVLLWLCSQFYCVSVQFPRTFRYRSLHIFTDESKIFFHQKSFRSHWHPEFKEFGLKLMPISSRPAAPPAGNYTTTLSLPGINAIWHDPKEDLMKLERRFVSISQLALCCYILGIYSVSVAAPKLAVYIIRKATVA